MMLAALDGDFTNPLQIATSAVMLVAVTAAIYMGYRPLRDLIRRQEGMYDRVLRGTLLLDIAPRSVTISTGILMVMLGGTGYAFTKSIIGVLAAAAVAAIFPSMLVRIARHRRLRRLEDQLVEGIVTLASGVRAGLNLVQAMELVSRDGPAPLKQEFAHLLREYEFGIPLEEAMENSSARIGSGDFRLLFAALQTHRERGGDLGQTLDRIAESIREIQRLERRVQTLTAQGRATARWLGAMPLVIGGIYYLIDSDSVMGLFNQGLGNLILVGVVMLNVIGFLWIKKIVSIDI